MQPIERVGLFALLFLGVLIAAVVAWDSESEVPGLPKEVAAAEKPEKNQKPAPTAPRTTSKPVTQKKPSTRTPQPKPQTSVPVASKHQPLAAPVQPPRTETRAKSRNLPRNHPKASDSATKPLSTSTVASKTEAPAFQAPPPRESKPSKPQGIPLTAKSTSKPSSSSKPATSSKTVPAKSGKTSTYVVAKGDVLGIIAQKTLGSSKRWKEIADLNPKVDPNRLSIGTELKLPADANVRTAGPVTTTARPASSAASAGSYTVGEGDSLWKIAARELGDGGRWAEIVALNPEINPDRLDVGAKLKLPEGRATRQRSTVAVASNAQPTSSRSTSGSAGRKVR